MLCVCVCQDGCLCVWCDCVVYSCVFVFGVRVVSVCVWFLGCLFFVFSGVVCVWCEFVVYVVCVVWFFELI